MSWYDDEANTSASELAVDTADLNSICDALKWNTSYTRILKTN